MSDEIAHQAFLSPKIHTNKQTCEAVNHGVTMFAYVSLVEFMYLVFIACQVELS